MRRMGRKARLTTIALTVVATILGAACGSEGAPRDNADESSAQADAVTTPADLNGTYRWVLTQEDADKAGDNDPEDVYPLVTTITLTDGQLEGGCFGAAGGSYKVDDDQITFHSREYDTDATVTFSIDDEGSLHLTPAPSMDPGDAFQCFSKVWTKIG